MGEVEGSSVTATGPVAQAVTLNGRWCEAGGLGRLPGSRRWMANSYRMQLNVYAGHGLTHSENNSRIGLGGVRVTIWLSSSPLPPVFLE